jgi:hypothetical protein
MTRADNGNTARATPVPCPEPEWQHRYWALEEPHPEAGLEGGDAPAQLGLRLARGAARGREAAMVDDLGVVAEVVEILDRRSAVPWEEH